MAVTFGVDKSKDSITEAKRRHAAPEAAATRGAAVVFEEVRPSCPHQEA
jgi:hypothetical protein